MLSGGSLFCRFLSVIMAAFGLSSKMGVLRFQQLLAYSSKMADVASTSTDKRSVTLLTTYNTRSVHTVTHRAQQNLRHLSMALFRLQQFASNLLKSNTTSVPCASKLFDVVVMLLRDTLSSMLSTANC